MDSHSENAGMRELIAFRIGEQEFCVDIITVREIRGFAAATPLPHAPNFVVGVINLRGAVVPVMDLAARFGRAPTVQGKRTCIVIVELGANDALRGLDLSMTESNLRAILADCKKIGARTLLLGMMLPPNYGKAYGDRFAGLYKTAAQAEQSALVPFFLDVVAEHGELFQADRVHPTEQAQAQLLDNVWPYLEKLLKPPGHAGA